MLLVIPQTALKKCLLTRPYRHAYTSMIIPYVFFQLGVFVVYFLDYCVGGGWWVLAVTLAELCAVFMLRGRPYTGELISTALFGSKLTCVTTWAVPLLTFAWNVVMPVAVLGVCIAIFKTGYYKDMWVWRATNVRAGYWPHWARQVGVLIQLVPLLCIPVVALIQTYRYLTNGPPDILEVSIIS